MKDMETLRAKVISLAGTPMLFQALVSESRGRDVRVNVVGNSGGCQHSPPESHMGISAAT